MLKIYSKRQSSGILVVGGLQNGKSTELFLPSIGKSCSMADLPDAGRYAHTMDILAGTPIVCAGNYRDERIKSCIQFSPVTSFGVWNNFSSTETVEPRYGHTSWVSPNGSLFLFGGWDSPKTSEVVSGGKSFNLIKEVKLV